MSTTQEFLVTVPPTGGEVLRAVLDAVADRQDSVPLTLIDTQEVPTPEAQEILFAVRHISPELPGSRVQLLGRTASHEVMTVALDRSDDAAQATATITWR